MGLGNSLLCRETSPHSCPFHPPQPHLSFTELGFPLTCILSESCLVFFVHATLKFSGTRSQGCYFSATVSNPLSFFCFFFLFVCLFVSCLVLKFETCALSLHLTIVFLSSPSWQWCAKLLAFMGDPSFPLHFLFSISQHFG